MFKGLFAKPLEEGQVVVSQQELTNLRGQLEALSKSQAVIEFDGYDMNFKLKNPRFKGWDKSCI